MSLLLKELRKVPKKKKKNSHRSSSEHRRNLMRLAELFWRVFHHRYEWVTNPLPKVFQAKVRVKLVWLPGIWPHSQLLFEKRCNLYTENLVGKPQWWGKNSSLNFYNKSVTWSRPSENLEHVVPWVLAFR